jgi:uncharacterized membrane protein
MSQSTTAARTRGSPPLADRLSDHWLGVFLVVYGLWVSLPVLAPVFMHIGWTEAGQGLYTVYSLFCHQLPERSFFLFGQKAMYSLAEIQSVWEITSNPLILRRFLGTIEMGWKVAWSDRMISFYGGIWLFAILWTLLRRKIRPLPWWGLLLLVLPLVVDGTTHLVSDFAGIGQGFRDSNAWLAALTNDALSASFYVGDAGGSFNSLMRLITGLLAAAGIVWFGFPYVGRAFGNR